MRSLEEWTKYLEQQELALQETLEQEGKSNLAEDKPEEPLIKTASVPPPEPSKPARDTWFAHEERVRASDAPSSPGLESPSTDLVQAAAEMRKKLPGQLQLIGGEQSEVAQSSYKRFKETREELLQRLLDPELTLEDAARVLNVCPTTVRRYTNRGVLKHFRTAGNQRRFRLSDVLAFLESQSSISPSEGVDPDALS